MEPPTLHKLKPDAYDAPTQEKSDPNVWNGPPSGPEYEAWIARSFEALQGASMMPPEALFVCEGGDPSTAVAFEEFPPDDVIASLELTAGRKLRICTECYPEKAQ